MRSLAISSAFAAAFLLTACARARVTTQIQPDGSWTRTVALTGQQKKDGLQATPTLEDTFAIPSGAEWKSTDELKDNNRTLTFERSFPPGASLQGDVSIKSSEPGKMRLVNQVTVKPAGPHRWEYRETLQWKGPPTKLLGDIRPEDLARLKMHLPKPLATDANARALADKTAVLAIPVLFGPGDPLLALGLLHPDLAMYRASQRIGAVLVKALEQQFGDQMTPTERRQVVQQLIQETFSSGIVSQPDPSAVTKPANSSGLTPLMFIVKPPGRVVSTNGEIDEFSGEIFWALFEEAALYQDVVLTAIVDSN